MKLKSLFTLGFVVGPLVALDHWTKMLILSHKSLLPYRVTPFLSLVYTRNRGVSFGIFPAHTSMHVFLLGLLAGVLSFALLIWYLRTKETWLRLGLLLILGGALGNLLDRILWGSVIDFVDFHWFTWHFPAFNFADSCITCGTGLVLWTQFMENSRKIR